MKVKIFRERNTNDLESKINSFINGKTVVDIKLSDDGTNIVALIMYK